MAMTCVVTPALYMPAILLGYRWYFLGILLSVFAAALLVVDARPSMPSSARRIGWLLALWMSVNFISATWAAYPSATLLSSFYVLILAVFFISGAVLGARFPPIFQARFFSLCTVSAGLVFAYMLVNYGTVRPITDEVFRVFGAGANAGGMHVVVALPILLWRFQAERTVANLLILILALVIVVVSQSRAAYLSLVIGFMLWMILHRSVRYSRSARLLFSVSLVGLMLVMVLAVSPETVLRLLSVGRAISDPSVLIGEGQGDLHRLAVYYFGWLAFTENPILGIGYKNLEYFMEERVGFGESSHNLILTLLAETGIPGTLCFLVLMVVCFKIIRRSVVAATTVQDANWRIAVCIAILITLLNGMFHQVPEFQLFHLLLGMMASWPVVEPDERMSDPGTAGEQSQCSTTA